MKYKRELIVLKMLKSEVKICILFLLELLEEVYYQFFLKKSII